jgi:hypothetical protein
MSDALAHAAPGEKLRAAPLTVANGIRAAFGLLMLIGIVNYAM